MTKVALTVVLVLSLFAGIIVFNERRSQERSDVVYSGTAQKQLSPTTQPTPMPTQSMNIDESVQYTAKVTTSKGDFTIEFNKGQTPMTINNFLTLATKGFYDKTIFHRVIKGFMIQGGDPTGTGSGGPGYRFNDEPFEGSYTRGTVAMANAGPNTNGSQFFIMHEDQQLPPNYTIFGKVTDGMDTIDAIATAPVEMSNSGEMSKPIEPVSITKIEVSPALSLKK